MRWNPRRRRLTSVVYVHSGKPAGPEKPQAPKSPWNSLEVVKIIVGVLTPVCLLAFGTYVTLQSHAEDVRRIAADELRARKATALPVIYDLDQQYSKFVTNARDAVYRAHAVVRVEPDKPKLAVDEVGRFHAASDEYTKHFEEDWLKLRALLTDDKQYDVLHSISRDQVHRVVDNAAHDCIYAVIDEKGKDLPKKCDAVLSDSKPRNCQFLVNLRLERFDSDESPRYI